MVRLYVADKASLVDTAVHKQCTLTFLISVSSLIMHEDLLVVIFLHEYNFQAATILESSFFRNNYINLLQRTLPSS